MRSLVAASFFLTALAALAGPATAQPDQPTATPAPTPRWDVGARIGGWGYRREGDPRAGAGWQAGRMNGVGVFGSRVLTRRLYLEAMEDIYANSSKVFIDAKGGSNMLYLPLDKLIEQRRQGVAPAAAPAARAPGASSAEQSATLRDREDRRTREAR